jgi:predicted TIM-barrel fold metal-dependent hydrolase
MWDTSVFLGHWPFRPLPDSTPERLEACLRKEGITRAFVSPLEALFYGDPQQANRFWGERLRDSAFWQFVPVVNPGLTGWERALDTCREDLGAAAIRLHPNYHGYGLDSERVRDLMEAAATHQLPVLIQLRMQDARAMHPLAQVPDLDWHDALALARRCPETTTVLVACTWSEWSQAAKEAADMANLYFDISYAESVDGIHRFVDRWGVDRLLFATHAPLFIPASARLKVEQARLTPEQRQALVQGNAERVFARRVTR